ncbi:steroid receptor RNA activator 1 [Polyodon spathula]|nr:steroid receptor RNA activator 1 [Polyodon spathula]
MAESYVKPGNQEKGWNDPPQFSYGLQTQAQGVQKRNFLNKRVPPPQLDGSQVSLPSGAPLPAKPLSPTLPLAPPPSTVVLPARRLSAVDCTALSASTHTECEATIEDVMGLLDWALTACRTTVKRQVCDEVSKRLTLFQEMWISGKLSSPVKKRMYYLAEELKKQNWDSADETHRSLIVDYVNEVSQWMVGVKRLIAETRNLPTEVLNAEVEGPSPKEDTTQNTQ